jgi:hypothetical protein
MPYPPFIMEKFGFGGIVQMNGLSQRKRHIVHAKTPGGNTRLP